MLDLLSYYSTTLTLFFVFYLVPSAAVIWWLKRRKHVKPLVKTTLQVRGKPKVYKQVKTKTDFTPLEKYRPYEYAVAAIFPTFFVAMTVWSLIHVVFIDPTPQGNCNYDRSVCD